MRPADARALQGKVGGLDGSKSEELRLEGSRSPSGDASQWCAEGVRDPAGSEEGGRGPIVQRGRVARRHRAISEEQRLEIGQPRDAGVFADRFVTLEIDAVHVADLVVIEP